MHPRGSREKWLVDRLNHLLRCDGWGMKDIPTINSLIETLKDGQEGFRVAGEDAESPELKSLFAELSQQRGRFAGELQALAKILGESDPTDSGSVAGAFHRGWINLKSAVATRNAHAILAECERGEDSAVAEYKKALEETELSGQLRERITAQFTEIKAAHDRVRILRDSLAAK